MFVDKVVLVSAKFSSSAAAAAAIIIIIVFFFFTFMSFLSVGYAVIVF
jgi:hypothetical protein